MDKTDKNILSVDVIKKAEEIEKLAKSCEGPDEGLMSVSGIGCVTEDLIAAKRGGGVDLADWAGRVDGDC